ncbi:YIPF1 protein [Terfezia boudieri ATCC MYA-4762]|uniref:Protein YIP n=1 Tax=Terfezia boudieri ATCC MYA-4762 TaxID=1051890 RepID=A0A3N4M1A6_9PEZI|nr:YIPF1 protein [Terfezia boudieri ATCC MYA-4762]
MSSGDYNVVIDIDDEGDLGDLEFNQELEFHHSNFNNEQASGKIPQGEAHGGTPAGFFSAPPTTRSGGSKRFLWSLEFYARFFDVDTNEVLRRCWATLFLKTNFLDLLDGNPDLYGPIWITTTVVLTLFLSSTIQGYFASTNDKPYRYNFDLLSGAAGLMYGYTGIIPLALWGGLKWYGSEGANLLECLCLYGYANLIWIPIAIASASPIAILNWVFVTVGFGLSVAFLLRNLDPVVRATGSKTSKIMLLVVILLHAGLSLTIKILFFQYTSPVTKLPTDAPKEPAPTYTALPIFLF